MPAATSSAGAAAATTGQTHPPAAPIPPKPEMLDPSSSSSPSGPIRIDGSEHDAALAGSEFITRPELLNRRARRLKQLARIYRDHYWALMEELKLKYREYYWEYGKSPFVEDEDNERITSNRGGDYSAAVASEIAGNGNLGINGNGSVSGRCEVHGCKAKALALTKFCYMHITVDTKQQLYKLCTYPVKSSTTGPILCGKPALRSLVPPYCPPHFQKAEKQMVRALKKAGLNVTSTGKLAPKLHVIVAEYVRQIQHKRRAAQKAKLENKVVIKEENTS